VFGELGVFVDDDDERGPVVGGFPHAGAMVAEVAGALVGCPPPRCALSVRLGQALRRCDRGQPARPGESRRESRQLPRSPTARRLGGVGGPRRWRGERSQLVVQFGSGFSPECACLSGPLLRIKGSQFDAAFEEGGA
jgi:hypothetical protein